MAPVMRAVSVNPGVSPGVSASRPVSRQRSGRRPQGISHPRHLRTPMRPRAASSNALSAAEVHALREDTPGLRGVRHDTRGGIAHFNAAGSSLPPRPVLDAQLEYLTHEAMHGGYETSETKADALSLPYAALASLLNCQPDEIAITQSATAAWQMAFGSLLSSFNPGDIIITAQCEYASNYINYLQASKEKGVVIETAPSDENGQLDVHALERMLQVDANKNGNGKVKLVSVTHIPTSGGLVNPAEAIGEVTKRFKVPFLLDATQSAGQVVVDVAATRCDFLVGTGRKYLRGPRGIGFLYARNAFIEETNVEPVMLDLCGARWDSVGSYVPARSAKRFEQYEVAFCAKAGLGVAVQYALDVGITQAFSRTKVLAEKMRAGLGSIDGVTVRDVGSERCGIVTFDVAGVDVAIVKQTLHERGVNVWTSRVCNNTRLEWETRKAGEGKDDLPQDIVRASVHYYNQEWEVERLLESVKEIARG